jgi:hypothetical protein
LLQRHRKSVQTWIDDVQFLVTRYSDYNAALREQMPAEDKRFDTLAIDSSLTADELHAPAIPQQRIRRCSSAQDLRTGSLLYSSPSVQIMKCWTAFLVKARPNGPQLKSSQLS